MRFPLRVATLVLGCVTWTSQAFAASEMEERKLIVASVREAFLRDEFARLEDTSRMFLGARSRTASGLWKLTLFSAGISSGIKEIQGAHDRETAFRLLDRKISDWAKLHPNSPNPPIALAEAHLAHAWAYRGTGYAGSVKPEDWAPFRKFVALARESLERGKSVAAVDPRWYDMMIAIAQYQGWERAEFDSLLEEGLAREPAYYQSYFRALSYLLPKWHGSTKEIEEFALAAVRRTSPAEGQGMYARIYWYAAQTQYGNQLFDNTLVSWPRMKSGFEDVVARYPDSWNLNNYAKFACLARDKAKTRELLNRIRTAVDYEAWKPSNLLHRCSDWAFDK